MYKNIALTFHKSRVTTKYFISENYANLVCFRGYIVDVQKTWAWFVYYYLKCQKYIHARIERVVEKPILHDLVTLPVFVFAPEPTRISWPVLQVGISSLAPEWPGRAARPWQSGGQPRWRWRHRSSCYDTGGADYRTPWPRGPSWRRCPQDLRSNQSQSWRSVRWFQGTCHSRILRESDKKREKKERKINFD